MKEPKPDWLERMKADPTPGKTLPPSLLRKIEDRRMEGNARGTGRKRTAAWILTSLSAAILVLVLFIQTGGLDQKQTSPTSNPTVSMAPTPSPEPASPTPAPTKAVARLKGTVEALPRPEAITTEEPVFLAFPNREYEVLETKGAFTHIALDGMTGWIPSWYVIQDAAGGKVAEVTPYEMLVPKIVKYSLYPGEPEPSGFELWAGKVVRVHKTYEDWVAVAVITYDSFYVGDKWLPKSALIPYDPTAAKEGRLKQGAAVYDEKGRTKDPLSSDPIFIEGESNGRYRISSTGGYTGYIEKPDFVPNPFAVQQKNGSWELSAAKQQLYNEFVKTKEEQLLRGLEPLDLFLFYARATLAGDNETQHALYNQGPNVITPSKEEFLKDISKDPDGAARSKAQYENMAKNYLLEQIIDGESALIVLYPKGRALERKSGSPPTEGDLGFSLTRSHTGIWKVNWMPMQ